MTDIMTSFQNQVWRIQKMDGLTVVSQEFLPVSEASEDEILRPLEERAKKELTPREIRDAPQLFQARDMTGTEIASSIPQEKTLITSQACGGRTN